MQTTRLAPWLSAASLAASLAASPLALADPVDDRRLLAAPQDAANWLSYGRDYTNQRFSPLATIDRSNVRQLAPRWLYQTGIPASFQATPLVVDGIMYLALPYNHVVAIDAVTGQELWRYEHKRVTDKMCCGPANRGVAVAYGKVFMGTVDARLIALDAKTGKPEWDVPLATDGGPTEAVDQLDSQDGLRRQAPTGTTGVGANMAPLVVDGKVVIGITGVGYGLHLEGTTPNAPVGAVVGFAGSYGRPGFYAAFDAKTGQRVWQFDTIAATGWEGELRIAISELLPFARVIDLVREFDELGAQTELRLTRENFGGMWDALIDGRADLTIGAPDMPVQGNLYCRELGHAAFGFCVAPSHPLAQAAEPIPAHELRKHRIIVLADSSRTLTPRSASIQEGQTRLTVSSLDDKINMQCAGLGIGFLPLQHVQKPLADGRLLLKAVEDARDPVPLYYAWQTKEPGQAMAWFLQRLRDFDWHLL